MESTSVSRGAQRTASVCAKARCGKTVQRTFLNEERRRAAGADLAPLVDRDAPLRVGDGERGRLRAARIGAPGRRRRCEVAVGGQIRVRRRTTSTSCPGLRVGRARGFSRWSRNRSAQQSTRRKATYNANPSDGLGARRKARHWPIRF